MKKCKHCTIELPLSEFETERSLKCNKCKKIAELEKMSKVPLKTLKRAVQVKVNAYVRERDKNLPCISCGKRVNKYDAGHYISQGSSGALRFNLDNINNQCGQCNRWKSGNLVEYRIGLVKKIGEDRVKWLEEHRHDIKKWTREELEEVMNSLLTSANG